MKVAGTLRQIVSGGQTGVDRAALDVAIALGIPHGGWCPRGRRAEDGMIDERYALRECDSREYRVRTELNVQDSDATLIIKRGPLRGGTKLTQSCAFQQGKPLYVVDLDEGADVEDVRQWLVEHKVEVLNVAGPREGSVPGIYAEARGLLEAVLRGMKVQNAGSRQGG